MHLGRKKKRTLKVWTAFDDVIHASLFEAPYSCCPPHQRSSRGESRSVLPKGIERFLCKGLKLLQLLLQRCFFFFWLGRAKKRKVRTSLGSFSIRCPSLFLSSYSSPVLILHSLSVFFFFTLVGWLEWYRFSWGSQSWRRDRNTRSTSTAPRGSFPLCRQFLSKEEEARSKKQ